MKKKIILLSPHQVRAPPLHATVESASLAAAEGTAAAAGVAATEPAAHTADHPGEGEPFISK